MVQQQQQQHQQQQHQHQQNKQQHQQNYLKMFFITCLTKYNSKKCNRFCIFLIIIFWMVYCIVWRNFKIAMNVSNDSVSIMSTSSSSLPLSSLPSFKTREMDDSPSTGMLSPSLHDNNVNQQRHRHHLHNPFSIGIFVATNQEELYDNNLQSIKCYGKRHGYDVMIVNNLNQTTIVTEQNRTLHLFLPNDNNNNNDNNHNNNMNNHNNYPCQFISAFSFQRQCVVARILPYYDFLVVLDADVGVANANITIESILQRATSTTTTPTTSTTTSSMSQQQQGEHYSLETRTLQFIPHIIHEERMHTGEIMAASYIVQNTSFAIQYLQRWNAYYWKLPSPEPMNNNNNNNNNNKLVNKFYHNHRDNPTLNLIFLETLAYIVSMKNSTMASSLSSSSSLSLSSVWTSTEYLMSLEEALASTSTSTSASTSASTSTISKMHPFYHNYYQSLIDECYNLWKKSRGNQRYMMYLKCIQNNILQILNDNNNNNNDNTKMYPLYLFRRGHGGLGRDINTCNGKVSSLDLFVHNVKEHSTILQPYTSGFYTQRPTCPSITTTATITNNDSIDNTNNHNNDIPWQAPIHPDRWLSILEMKELMKTSACKAKGTHIGDCWPNCTAV